MGWLRVGRLKKLFEDESYRVMAVAKLNKTLDRKIGPDDHIDDVVSADDIRLLLRPSADTSMLKHNFFNSA